MLKQLPILLPLLLLLLIPSSPQFPPPLLQSKRTNLPAHTVPQNYSLTFQSAATQSQQVGIVLSLASFSEGVRIGVRIVRQTGMGFVVEATAGVGAFSYLVVGLGDGCGVGDIGVVFGGVGPVASQGETVLDVVQITGHNSMLQQFGTIQPFISQFSTQQTPLTTTSTLSLNPSQTPTLPPTISITRSPDITLLKISYLIYIKLSSTYLTILPPTGTIRFNYANSNQPIFVGVSQVGVRREVGKEWFWGWVGSLRAEVWGVWRNVLVGVANSSRCTGVLSAVINRPDMMTCQPTCTHKLTTITNQTICISNSSSYTPPIAPFSIPSIPITLTLQLNQPQKCTKYHKESTYLYCQQCNHNNNFVEIYNGSCFCKQGYYAVTGRYLQQPVCYACGNGDGDGFCGFQVMGDMEVVVDQGNSSELLNIRVTINQGKDHIQPYRFNSYQQLLLEIWLNNRKIPQPILNWTSQNHLTIQIQPQYSQIYTLTIVPKNSILLSNNNTYIYQSPQTPLQLNYSHPQPAKLIASSMQAIGNAAPTAALVSLLLGSKVNLFSFMQVSSTMYLSSYVGWQGFGSINRVSLSQALFKLTPSNFLATLQLKLPIPVWYSNDDSAHNLMLKHNDNQLYISVAPQYWVSTIIQILLIQIIFRILTLIFPITVPQTSQISQTSKITFPKLTYLTRYFLSTKCPPKQKLTQLLQKLHQKRLIFYTTLLCSQLVFHSFMIFSQFKINVSSFEELVNFMFVLVVLGGFLGIFCLGSRDPMVLLKTVGVLRKKGEYWVGGLFLCYVLGVLELVVFGASVGLFQHSMQQCAPVIIILALKTTLMHPTIKPIQLLKTLLLLTFFILLGCGTYFPNSTKIHLQTACIGIIFAICLIQLLKIFRSVVVLILGFLRQPPSIKGKAILREMVQKGKFGVIDPFLL